MEQKIKSILGEYAFTIAALQQQIETLSKENEELKKDKKKS